MQKRYIPALLLATTLLLSACEKEEAPKQPEKPGEVVTVTEQLIDGIPEGNYITKEGERITITSLAVWEEFNYDGNFSDNCLQFLKNFIENDSEFLEFNTVTVSDYEIIRDFEVYGYKMAFNFTVSASALSTLPVGSYRTIVTDAVDCYMQFEGDAPNAATGIEGTEATKTVEDWILSSFRWEMPAYGESEEPARYVNFLVGKYGKENKMLYSDFKTVLKDKAGIYAEAEDFSNQLLVENDKLYIMRGDLGGNTCFLPIAERDAGDHTLVTVQFYADCNKFIPSMQVEYRIGKDGKLLGCTILENSPYKPYGLRK